MKAACAARLSSPALQCNGGGSGSLLSTLQDTSVSEVTVGSGVLCGHLFDGYEDINYMPSLYFSLTITRRPDSGGGWIASGCSGPDHVPQVVSPAGGKLLPMEGCGEVQTVVTPILLPSTLSVGLGDAAIFRPAKSGELGDVLRSYDVVRADGTYTVVNTYRGDGIAAW